MAVGVELHANIVDGILNQRVKFHPPYTDGAPAVLLVLLGLVMTLVLTRYSVIPATLITVMLLAAIVVLNAWLWQRYDFIVPLAVPLLFVLLVFGLQIPYGLLIESRGTRYLSQMFGQYIPPELVEEMDRSQQDLSLEGVSREMTVLFSDQKL